MLSLLALLFLLDSIACAGVAVVVAVLLFLLDSIACAGVTVVGVN